MTTDLEADLRSLASTLEASTVAVRSARGAGSGSGVVWSADGVVVTNAHVARTAIVEIEFADGRCVYGKVERRDDERDLAGVRVALHGLTPVRYRDPAELRVGEFVCAFGHPLGVRNVLSTGIVHACYRAGAHRFVKADLKLAPGNSGGALADAAGCVVGINSMVAGELALAIPADDVRRFLGEAAARPRLGVRLAAVRLAGGRAGHVVLETEAGSIAERSGLIAGDIIVAPSLDRLAAAQRLEIVRGGNPLRVPLAGPMPEAASAA
jgi:serine protease Do